MWNLREEILSSSFNNQVDVTELDTTAVESLRGQILAKFASGLSSWPVWIWEHLPDTAILVFDEGWGIIAEFASDSPTVLLLNPRDESAGFMFPSGQSAKIVLADCIGFEVYFTDTEVTYLLIHNHHDRVIGCGQAKVWMEQCFPEFL
ncbi:MAG: DUF6756 family protein [Zavarzinella sp.]